MYRYERHFGSFYRNSTILETVSIASKWVNMHLSEIFLNITTGNNSSTDVSLLRLNVKIKCKEYLSYRPAAQDFWNAFDGVCAFIIVMGIFVLLHV